MAPKLIYIYSVFTIDHKWFVYDLWHFISDLIIRSEVHWKHSSIHLFRLGNSGKSRETEDFTDILLTSAQNMPSVKAMLAWSACSVDYFV